MNLTNLPEKLKKELELYIKDKFIASYRRHLPGEYVHPYQMIPTEVSITINKYVRPMLIDDLFQSFDDPEEQKNLQKIFELEKELIELRKLKDSINNIKSIFKE